MQRYARKHGRKFQDVALINDEAALGAFATRFRHAARHISGLDSELLSVFRQASRLLDIYLDETAFIPPELFDDVRPSYSAFIARAEPDQRPTTGAAKPARSSKPAVDPE